jgi:hypothetical protein
MDVAVPSEALNHLGRGTLEHAPHLCAFFETPEEEVSCLAAFIIEGLDRGEKAFHIIDPAFEDIYVDLLESAGIPARSAIQTGQFEIVTWENAHFRTGGFDQFDMLEFVQSTFQNARDNGYPLTRFVAHMEWALTDRPGVNDLIEYEARLDEVLANFPDPVVCVYDSKKFGAGVALNVLRTHPYAIIGGTLHANPFHVPPAAFLKELRGELAATPGS